eukprot:scaffold24751_cov60-Phaeocystis_antarctica.AAC.1
MHQVESSVCCKEARTSQGRPTEGYWWAHGPSPRLTISRPCSSHVWLVEAATQCDDRQTSSAVYSFRMFITDALRTGVWVYVVKWHLLSGRSLVVAGGCACGWWISLI